MVSGRPTFPPLKAGLAAAAIAAFAVVLPATPSAAADCSADPAPGVDWTDCDKKIIVLSGSDFSAATLVGTDFTSTDLRDSNLMTANLEKAALVRASLAGSHAEGAKFDRAEAYRTNFSGINAKGATFASSEMQRSNFANAVLVNVDFTKADLARADFAGADINGAKFAFANLARADLTKAKFDTPLDFANAFLLLTRIEGLDLSAATGLVQWQIDMSCGDGNTKLPEGLNPGSSWPCKFD
ncbi:pentapeptide repeat-containing protein [Mesorhizobium sp. KR9-304]|uniref:pentapeptide repeat-containing protein n=1 Tax=Mesorhizobium sp. KR9-304 TaxID=3156614 RepID=UPI0032B52D13